MLTTQKIYVRVNGIDRKYLNEAKVTLEALGKVDRNRSLKFDKTLGMYVGKSPESGDYNISVSAKGLESQTRLISFPHPARPESFILGKKGLPFYYRGAVKTPFEPKDNLIAVTVNTSEGREGKTFGAFIQNLGLKPVKTHEQILNNNVRLFEIPKAITKGQRGELIGRLASFSEVALVGPVIEHFEERVTYLTHQLIVKCRPNVTQELAQEIAKKFGLRVVRSVPVAGNAYVFEGKPSFDYALLEVAAKLTELNDIIYAEPNAVMTSNLFAVNPADFLVSQQWHIPLINLPDAWETLRNSNSLGTVIGGVGDKTFGDENITIAVYDTGIESSTSIGITTPSHPDFQGNVTSGAPKVTALYNFATMVANNDSLSSDHGMGCAGVAAAAANNPPYLSGETEGVAGAAGNCPVVGIVAPFGYSNLRWADSFMWMAGFNPGWVADGSNYPIGTVFPANLAQSIDVHTSSVRIPDAGLLDDALDFMATYGRGGRGIVSCVAAGNTPAPISNPSNNTIADHDKIIAVAASASTEVRSSYSAIDPALDVCGPSSGGSVPGSLGKVTCDLMGGGNLAGVTGGGLNYRNNFGGTSSATPLTAGLAALMLSINPNLNWVQIREILRNTAVKIDAANTDPIGQWTVVSSQPVFSQWYGFGRINADAAIIAARDFGNPSDVVIRDNLSDTGVVPSTGWHAHSPDIWTRVTNDPIPTLAYSANPPHQNPIRNQDNYLYLRVKNTGAQPTNEVYLRALICHFPGFEFRYPQEWIPSISPGQSIPSPLVPGTYLIGEQLVDNLAGGADTIVKMTWNQNLIPPETVMVGGMSVNWHPCILAEASPHDSGPSTGSHDVKRYNDLAHRNISIDNFNFSGFSSHAVVAGSSHRMGVESLIIDRSQVLSDARVFVIIDDDEHMEKWLELAKLGELQAAKKLPWRKAQDKRSLIKEKIKAKKFKSKDLVMLREDTKLSINTHAGNSLIIEAKRGTRLSLDALLTRTKKPEVFSEKIKGTQVLVFEGGGATTVEIPMPISGEHYIPMAIGIVGEKGMKWGTIRATQRLANGEISAGYEISSS